MAYYDKLIAAWNGATQPPTGVTGTGLTAGMTTQQKLNAVNGWTVAAAAAPMIIPTYLIYNAIVGSEFAALSAANQQLIRDILGMGSVDCSPGTQVRARIMAVFPNGTTTFANLAALAAKYDSPTQAWWLANGYRRALNMGDAVVAGLDTTTGYSATVGAPASSQFNVQVTVSTIGPKSTESVSTSASTLDADYAKYFAANCVQNMIVRDASLTTFGP